MHIQYIGPFVDGVVVPLDVGEVACPREVTVELPDGVARGLLEQPTNWRVPPVKKREVAANE